MQFCNGTKAVGTQARISEEKNSAEGAICNVKCQRLFTVYINKMSVADDEVQALQGIFCGDGEFEMLPFSDGESHFSICVTCQPKENATTDQSKDSLKMSLQCFLPIGYPNEPPALSLACASLTKHSANQLQEELHEYAKSLVGQPMIMELIYWLQENGMKFTAKQDSVAKHQKMDSGKDTNTPYAAVLHIDHMRSQARYIKTLVSWATELSLIGRLLFLNQLILVLLIGRENGVKDFLVRLRTQKVDIDSSGRSCKERMMTVLMQGSHPEVSDYTRLSDFQVHECFTSTELEDVFLGAGLQVAYRNAVLPKFSHLQRSTGKSASKR